MNAKTKFRLLFETILPIPAEAQNDQTLTFGLWLEACRRRDAGLSAFRLPEAGIEIFGPLKRNERHELVSNLVDLIDQNLRTGDDATVLALLFIERALPMQDRAETLLRAIAAYPDLATLANISIVHQFVNDLSFSLYMRRNRKPYKVISRLVSLYDPTDFLIKASQRSAPHPLFTDEEWAERIDMVLMEVRMNLSANDLNQPV